MALIFWHCGPVELACPIQLGAAAGVEPHKGLDALDAVGPPQLFREGSWMMSTPGRQLSTHKHLTGAIWKMCLVENGFSTLSTMSDA